MVIGQILVLFCMKDTSNPTYCMSLIYVFIKLIWLAPTGGSQKHQIIVFLTHIQLRCKIINLKKKLK